MPGWTIRLVDGSGQPIQLLKKLEPDNYAQYALLNNVLDGVTLTAIGYDVRDSRVGAVEATAATGTKVFGAVRYGATDVWVTEWTSDSRNLNIELANPTTTISIDAVGPAAGGYGRLEIYDAEFKLLGRYTTKYLASGAVETMTMSVATPQIAYAIVKSTSDSTIRVDNLRVGPASTVTTDASGAYAMRHLPPGTYRVQAVPSTDWEVADPISGIRDVVVDSQGVMVWDTGSPRPSDFAGLPSDTAPPWRNPINSLDVNNDGVLAPIDALLVINELNRVGAHALLPPSGGSAPPPYLDVTGDNFVSPVDALRIINELNRRGGGGASGEPGSGGGSGGGGQGGSGEGGSGEGEDGSLSIRRGASRRETVDRTVAAAGDTLSSAAHDQLTGAYSSDECAASGRGDSAPVSPRRDASAPQACRSRDRHRDRRCSHRISRSSDGAGYCSLAPTPSLTIGSACASQKHAEVGHRWRWAVLSRSVSRL